jgi:hypothetical protein
MSCVSNCWFREVHAAPMYPPTGCAQYETRYPDSTRSNTKHPDQENTLGLRYPLTLSTTGINETVSLPLQVYPITMHRNHHALNQAPNTVSPLAENFSTHSPSLIALPPPASSPSLLLLLLLLHPSSSTALTSGVTASPFRLCSPSPRPPTPAVEFASKLVRGLFDHGNQDEIPVALAVLGDSSAALEERRRFSRFGS